MSISPCFTKHPFKKNCLAFGYQVYIYIYVIIYIHIIHTPPKTDVVPETRALEDDSPFGKAAGAMLILGTVSY